MEDSEKSSDTVLLTITEGPEKGRRIPVPPEGARIGRSSKNDIVLIDPMLSRHHCRVFFGEEGALRVTDLGSANKTVVNGSPIQETKLHDGDIISVGETQLTIGSGATAAPHGIIDLGLSSARSVMSSRPRRTGSLITVAVILALLTVAIWIPRLLDDGGSGEPLPAPAPAPEEQGPVHIAYEKIQASPENIFRYELTLDDRQLTIAIDDLENNRHVRKETEVEEELVDNLVRTIRGSGFMGLKEDYTGVQPEILDQWSVTITLGRDTHSARVRNRVEPDIFRSVRQTLEAFGKNELGLWAIQFSAEKLVEMARDAYLVGKKLQAEREVKYGNLAAAIKRFQEAEWYLETVEVKPDFYRELRSLTAECEQMLAERYHDQNFLAERAIRLSDWQQAARELRIVCEMIPDRSDPRHQEARKKLLDVEARLASIK